MKSEENMKAVHNALLGIIKMVGADVLAPMEVRQPKVKALGLNDNDLYKTIRGHIKQESSKNTRLNIVKGLMLETLTPTQLLELHDWVRECATGTLEYVMEHPEEREKTTPQDAILRLIAGLGSDFDIDKV